MKKELLQKCNLVAHNASVAARDEIRLFCQIMDWSDADVYFVADDPHGGVSLGDYFFNMSDIHEVVANYEKHIERFGSNEELSNAIIRWYDWTIDWHNKHMPMDWVKVKRMNALTKQVEYVTPEVQEGKSALEHVVFWTDRYGYHLGFYDKKLNRFVSFGRDYNFFRPNEVLYWTEIHEPDDTHNINLHSWLMGACDLVKKGE